MWNNISEHTQWRGAIELKWNKEMVPRLGLHMYTAEMVNLHKRQMLQMNDNSGNSNSTKIGMSLCSQEDGTS